VGPGAPDDCRWRDEAGAVSQEFGKSAERRASANQRRLATGSLANRQDGFQAAKRHLESKGIQFGEQNHGMSRSVYFTDPDGNPLEITYYVQLPV